MRRRFALLITALSALALSGCIGETSSSMPAPATRAPDWDRELAMMALPDADPAPDVVDVTLDARVSQVEVAGRMVEAWSYAGVVPGPVLRAKVGDLVRVHFENRLPEPTTIHWHGVEVPADQDGAGEEGGTIAPGASFDYAFRVPHAGTFWYHPHVNSAAQVWRGLYGALIVEDPAEPALGEALTLVLHDTELDESGALVPPAAQGDLGRYFGHEGSLLLVNGRLNPTLQLSSGSTLRLRLINASLSRYYRFGVDGHELVRIGSDVGLVPESESVSDLLLAPGDRAEAVLVVRGAVGAKVAARALSYDRFDCAGCTKPVELMQLALIAGQATPVTVPSTLTTIEPLDLSAATRRTVTLDEVDRDGQTYLGLNGHVHGQDPLVFMAKVGDTEVWEIENATEYDHPFHLHGFRFQVLDLNGEAPAQRTWEDTISVRRGETARIALTLDDRPGMWMFHCHILDHADLGMMGMLHVMP